MRIFPTLAAVALLLISCGRDVPDSVPVIGSSRTADSGCLWNLDSLSRAPETRWMDKEHGVRGLYFRTADCDGRPARAFAYYSNPAMLSGRPSARASYPGIVLLHGGAGRAFREWVEKWAAEGYAAIAVDLSGNGPGGEELPDGGPDLSDTQRVFLDAESGDMTSMWTYHAVSTAILAHSLLLSLPEVDPRRTVVTGISWGGYLTCIVASLDDRFRAAAPVYGCGFYDELEFFAYGMDPLSPAGQKNWMTHFDPSVYLPRMSIPVLFVNGNTDTAYHLFAYEKSCRLVADSLRTICIRPGMAHGYYEGWEPGEIRCFFESVLHDGYPLPRLGKAEVGADSVRVGYTPGIALRSASFHYSNDTLSRNPERHWETIPAKVDPKRGVITAPVPEEGVRMGFVRVEDIRGMAASTEFIVR